MPFKIKIIFINIADFLSRYNLEKFFIQSANTIALVLLYYFFSIGITFFQKSFIKSFHYPFIIVTCHLIIKWLLSFISRKIYFKMTKRPLVHLSFENLIRNLSIVGIVSSLDIGLSNFSFEYITISLYTMTKSTCIIFILMFAILFGLEKKRPSLILIILLISSGLFMFTYKSTQFNLTGFLLVLTASFLGGLRWCMAQIVMQGKELGLSNPIDMMYYIQPWMILGLMPLTIYFEGIPAWQNGLSPMIDENIGKNIIIGAFFAFLMELAEYLLLSYTSSLTLSIAGIFKEIFTLYLAIKYNGDVLSLINFVGLFTCLIGIVVHVVLKAREATVDHQNPQATVSSQREFRESERLLRNDDEIVIES